MHAVRPSTDPRHRNFWASRHGEDYCCMVVEGRVGLRPWRLRGRVVVVVVVDVVVVVV